jgi:hypothetical protein
MANFVNITLDTQAPASPTVLIEGGSVYATNQLVNLAISTSDGITTGYQMLIWGDVDPTYNASINTVEGTSVWTAYSTTPQIKLSAADGAKTINVRIRDDVHNPSSVASDSITLDTTIAVVTTAAPDLSKISKMPTKNSSSFTFTSNEAFTEYKVKLVGATGAAENTGTLIPTTGGSTGTSGTGTYTSGQVMSVTIKGADLETAGAAINTPSIIKVFVKDLAGIWSV